MFGKKKQKQEPVIVSGDTPAVDENMTVHTMQSDLQDAASGGAPQAPQDLPQQDIAAPFGTQTAGPAADASAPQEQQDVSPFAQQNADSALQAEPQAEPQNTFAQPSQQFSEQPSPQKMDAQPESFGAHEALTEQTDQAQQMQTSPAAGFGAESSLDQEISNVQNDENIMMQDDGAAPKKSRVVPILLLSLLAIIIITVIAAGYYFFQSRDAAQQAAQNTPVTINDAVEESLDDVSGAINDVADDAGDAMKDAGNAMKDAGDAMVDTLPDLTDDIVTPPSTTEYSEALPNYLLIDAEGDTQAIVNAKFAEIDQGLRAQQSASAIAFVVTDSSNAPIALQRYNDLTNLNLPAEVLSVVDEAFTLYAYNDNGETRFGLVADVTDSDTAANALRASEATLPSAFTQLFNGVPTTVTAPTFSDGTHGDTKIRYANLNDTETLSVDYAIVDDTMVIGTSKDTIRAILDKEAAL